MIWRFFLTQRYRDTEWFFIKANELPAPEGEGLGVGSVIYDICLYSDY